MKAFLSHHGDADMVFTFDSMSWEYGTVEDLEAEIDEAQEEFFSKPCAYFDLVVALLGRIRTMGADSIIVYSPQIDECSRLSGEFLYDNFILHFIRYNPGVLNINYSNLEYIPDLVRVIHPFRGIIDRLHLPKIDVFGLDNDIDDYDDFYSAG